MAEINRSFEENLMVSSNFVKIVTLAIVTAFLATAAFVTDSEGVSPSISDQIDYSELKADYSNGIEIDNVWYTLITVPLVETPLFMAVYDYTGTDPGASVTIQETVEYKGENYSVRAVWKDENEIGAFQDADVSNVILPESMVYIGDLAFSGSNIEEIVFPEYVAEIDVNAFKNCDKLSVIEFKGENSCSIEGDAFYFEKDHCHVNVFSPYNWAEKVFDDSNAFGKDFADATFINTSVSYTDSSTILFIAIITVAGIAIVSAPFYHLRKK